MSLFRDRYKNEIDQFFRGINYFDRHDGHTWVARHNGFDTLTVEPPEGGQYEIAVRIPYKGLEKDKYNIEYPFAGYIACEGYLWGVNTGGH